MFQAQKHVFPHRKLMFLGLKLMSYVRIHKILCCLTILVDYSCDV